MTPFKDPEKQRACNRRYYWRNKEKISERRKQWRLKHKDEIRVKRLGTSLPNGKHKTIYGLNKRPRPKHCELCDKENEKLVYHHWDDSEYSKGIWVCRGFCHTFCERVDSGLVEKYLGLKRKIESDIAGGLE